MTEGAWAARAFALAFGLALGSFLNVCIARIPEGRSIVRPGSACPLCGARIRWWQNIPILSYLLLRGRCAACGGPISLRYPIVEAATGILVLSLLEHFGPSPELGLYLVFSALLVVISFIDLDRRIIPDVLSLPGTALGLVAAPALTPLAWWEPAAGALLGGGILFAVSEAYLLLTGRAGMGGGDVKILAMIGAFLGWQAVPWVLLLSALSGTLAGLVLMAAGRAGRKTAIPYGPFLAAGALAWIFWGPEIRLAAFALIS